MSRQCHVGWQARAFMLLERLLMPWPLGPSPPQKYRGLMSFLSNVLREDGGFEYKKCIVEAILQLIREIPEAKEMGLAQVGAGPGG